MCWVWAAASEAVTVAQERPDGADRLRGPEGGAEEPHGIQILKPLAVLDIALPARGVLDVAGVHQAHLKAARLEDLVERDPVDAGRLHRHRGDAALPRGCADLR